MTIESRAIFLNLQENKIRVWVGSLSKNTLSELGFSHSRSDGRYKDKVAADLSDHLGIPDPQAESL
jgi:hypothetical protein